MNTMNDLKKNWLWLTVPVALFSGIAAAFGVFSEGAYAADAPYFAVQGVAQDAVILFGVIPVLLLSAVLAARGSRRWGMIWLGMMAYYIYSYLLYAFSASFNAMFLLYVAVLGCSTYALIYGLAAMSRLEPELLPGKKAKTLGVYLFIMAGLFSIVWLKEIIPALLSGSIPQSVIDNGLPTNPVHVIDLALLLPGMVIAGVYLRRGESIGPVLGILMLCFIIVMGLTIIALVVVMSLEGFVVDFSLAVIFGVVTLSGIGMMIYTFNGSRE